MAEGGDVTLICGRVSVLSSRVKIALREKNINFVARQNLTALERASIRMIVPDYQRIPILIHNGNQIWNSLAIIDYLDREWPAIRLIPANVAELASLPSWTQFIDNDVFQNGCKICTKVGQQKQHAKNAFLEAIRDLEVKLGDQQYFGGETFGYLDIALVSIYNWFIMFEKFGGFTVADICPNLLEWSRRCLAKDSVSQSLTHKNIIADTISLLLGVETLN